MKRISRRNFLKVAGVGAAALGLAACGGSSSSTASSTASSAAASAAPAEDVTIMREPENFKRRIPHRRHYV